MDDGFYSADYLRAWIRAAQVRAYLREAIGEDWWRRPETGDFLRELFVAGHAPVERGGRPRRSASTRSTRTPLVGELAGSRVLGPPAGSSAPAYTVRRRWHYGSRSSPRRSTTRCSIRRRRCRTSSGSARRRGSTTSRPCACCPPACRRQSRLLRGCDVKVCTVVSFPFGADTTKAKIAAAEQCDRRRRRRARRRR